MQYWGITLNWSSDAIVFKYGETLSALIIHQIFSLTRNLSKLVMWTNIPQLKLENIREYSSILKIARVAKKIWRIIKTMASIWGENMLGYLSLDIICSEKQTVFRERNIRPYFRAKWRLLFIYFRPKWRLLCLLSFKSFSQRAQFWKLGNMYQLFTSVSVKVVDIYLHFPNRFKAARVAKRFEG